MNIFLLLFALLALPIASFAQGTVQFLNTSTTLLRTNNLRGASGLTTGVNTYRIGLYIAPPGTTQFESFSLVGLATNQTGLGNGRFNGGTSFRIEGNTGETIAFQIRGWSFGAGLSYEQAVFGNGPFYAGVSDIGLVTPATGTTAAPALFGSGPGQVGGFELTSRIPEPPGIALGLLGFSVVAVFCRRK